MNILAIESSCDDTSVAITQQRRVLVELAASQVPEHILYGGVVPEIASRRHIEAIYGLYSHAMQQAGQRSEQLDAVAVTYAPGLIGSLLVGVGFAKGLAAALDIPLIPVHHLRSHIAANYITHPELRPPFLALVISGGHSHLIQVEDYTRFRIIGATRDDAAGECFDKTARAMGLPYPGGVHLDRVAQGGDPTRYKLPQPKVDGRRDSLDFSFSGLKTAVLNTIHNAEQRGEQIDIADMAACIRRTVTDILADRVARALDVTGAQQLVLAGGVSANSEIRARLERLCEQRSVGYFAPELKLCGDNAAMVGAQGYYEWRAGVRGGYDLNACATVSIERGYGEEEQ